MVNELVNTDRNDPGKKSVPVPKHRYNDLEPLREGRPPVRWDAGTHKSGNRTC